MPDITMCLNDRCHLKLSCFRYLAEPNQWKQSYSMYKPDISGQCGDFIFCENGRRAVKKDG